MSTHGVAAPAGIEADFCFINTGDSMINARIFDGDIVYIHQQSTAQDGDIIIFRYHGEVRIGIFSSGSDFISFTPANPQYKTLIFNTEEMPQVEIIGKAVAFLGTIQNRRNPG